MISGVQNKNNSDAVRLNFCEYKMTTDNDTIKIIHSLAAREIEIVAARVASPDLEIGAAYKKWKEARGETADMLLSSKTDVLKNEIYDLANRLQERPCTREGCAGTQRLEAICTGCIEGQAGYKTKWTCKTCMHRDLSKESLNEWMLILSSS